MIRVKFCTVAVADPERALKFYTEKMGGSVRTDQPLGDGRWIELAWESHETGLVLFTPPGMEDRVGTFQMLGLETDDIEATYRTLTSRGVEFIEPPSQQPWGIQAIFKDSEGNSFVMTQMP